MVHTRTAATLLAVLALLAAPASAFAQANPFAPIPQAQTTPTEVVVPASNTNNDSGGLEDWQEILIFAAGLTLLLGIGWAIATDARRRAPVKDSEIGHIGEDIKHNRTTRQKQQARAKAKAGRQHRKSNRR